MQAAALSLTARLHELATNLWWTWHPEVIAVSAMPGTRPASL